MLHTNYLLFDAAKAEASLTQAQQLNPVSRSLYKGIAEEDLAGIAPYLFSMQDGSEFEKWLLANGYGKSWGLFVSANISFEDCYKHFRKFLLVKTEGGKQLYFRFYDPRVLRIFLPTCDKEQLREFFGPIKMFIMEDEDPAYALQFWLQNYELKSKRVPAKEIFGDALAEKVDEKETRPSVTNVAVGKEEITVKEEPTIENIQPENKLRKRTFF
jgi:hypothetical protein